MASEKAKKAAAARLAKLDKESATEKKQRLRAKVRSGSRKVRRKASTSLSGLPKAIVHKD